MKERETPQIFTYEESKTTQIMMATVRHVTSSLGLRKFQTDGFLPDRVYIIIFCSLLNPYLLDSFSISLAKYKGHSSLHLLPLQV